MSEALRFLSDEDLDVLEELLEADVETGEAWFEDLYAVVGEKGRRALDAYYEAIEAVRRGEKPPSRDPPSGASDPDRDRLLEAQAEEILRERERGDGYRIWKYRK